VAEAALMAAADLSAQEMKKPVEDDAAVGAVDAVG
jgi:hypothetical protein